MYTTLLRSDIEIGKKQDKLVTFHSIYCYVCKCAWLCKHTRRIFYFYFLFFIESDLLRVTAFCRPRGVRRIHPLSGRQRGYRVERLAFHRGEGSVRRVLFHPSIHPHPLLETPIRGCHVTAPKATPDEDSERLPRVAELP